MVATDTSTKDILIELSGVDPEYEAALEILFECENMLVPLSKIAAIEARMNARGLVSPIVSGNHLGFYLDRALSDVLGNAVSSINSFLSEFADGRRPTKPPYSLRTESVAKAIQSVKDAHKGAPVT